MAKIVQVLTRPSNEYDVQTAESQVRDLDAEDAGSGTTIDVTLVNSSGAIFSLFKAKSISSNTTVELLTQPLVIEENESLKVQAAQANELHVIASILQIQPREVTT